MVFLSPLLTFEQVEVYCSICTCSRDDCLGTHFSSLLWYGRPGWCEEPRGPQDVTMEVILSPQLLILLPPAVAAASATGGTAPPPHWWAAASPPPKPRQPPPLPPLLLLPLPPLPPPPQVLLHWLMLLLLLPLRRAPLPPRCCCFWCCWREAAEVEVEDAVDGVLVEEDRRARRRRRLRGCRSSWRTVAAGVGRRGRGSKILLSCKMKKKDCFQVPSVSSRKEVKRAPMNDRTHSDLNEI